MNGLNHGLKDYVTLASGIVFVLVVCIGMLAELHDAPSIIGFSNINTHVVMGEA